MTLDSENQTLINEFFIAVHLRQLKQCRQLLHTLELRSQGQLQLQPWCTYLSGILSFEVQQDWAEAERIFSNLLQTAPQSPPLGRLLYALGRTLKVQGRWQEAVKIYEKALVLAEELGETLEKIKLWKQLAICCCEGFIQGDYDFQVLEHSAHYCRQALAVIESLLDDSASTRWLEGSIWNTLGATYRYLQKWDLALECFQRDLAICQRLNDQHGLGVSYLDLGEVYHHRNPPDWSQALAYYHDALRLHQQYQNRYLEADTLQNLGSLYQAMGEPAQALAHYSQAVAVIEDLRTRISAAEARTGFFTTMVETYSRLVRLLIETGDLPAAFEMVERARSRTFIELLAGQSIRTPQQAPATLVEREQTLRDELRSLYQTPDSPAERLAECERSLDATLQEIRLFDAEYADLRTVQPLTQRQVQERLSANAALISYFTTEEALYAFVVTPEQLTVHPLPLKPADLQRAFDEAGSLVRMQPGTDGRLHDPWMLGRLYQCLVQPLVGRLQGVDRLYLLPHGSLHFVPFHALSYRTATGETRVLLDDYPIVYAPSATVLLDYCQRKQGQAERSLLAIGYDGDLHHAEAEAVAVVGLTPGALASVNQAATSATLFAQAGLFRWVHIACHARFNRQAPLMSYLHLADGPLYASDILRQLRLQADLVTLSACETGRNKVLKGDELIGLVRAFIYAGAPSVVVSLWPVDELSTRILMERFYHELLAGQPKAEALRRAQHYLRTMTATQVEAILAAYGIANPGQQVQRLIHLTHLPTSHITAPAIDNAMARVFAHPYFWAPFVLVGDRV